MSAPTVMFNCLYPFNAQCKNYLFCCQRLNELSVFQAFNTPTASQYINFNIQPLTAYNNQNIITECDSELVPNSELESVGDNTYVQLSYGLNPDTQLCIRSFVGSPETPHFVRNVCDTYEKVVSNASAAQLAGVCLYNITPKTIAVNSKTPYAHTVQLHLTPQCLDISKTCQDSEDARVKYVFGVLANTLPTDFIYKPLEVYILAHLWGLRGSDSEHLQTLGIPTYAAHAVHASISFAMCDQICTDYCKGVLKLIFEHPFKNAQASEQLFIKNVQKTVARLINKPAKNIVCEMLAQISTWDNYSISLVYTHLILASNTSNDLLHRLADALFTNCSPNACNRKSLSNTEDQYAEHIFI
jgi:hypothetical protein